MVGKTYKPVVYRVKDAAINIPLTKRDKPKFKNATVCHVFDQPFRNVHEHCHIKTLRGYISHFTDYSNLKGIWLYIELN